MITYLYKCPICKKEKELKHSINEEPEIMCEICNARMRRVPMGGHAMFIKMSNSIKNHHGEGKEREKGRKDWIKKNPYYDKLPDHL